MIRVWAMELTGLTEVDLRQMRCCISAERRERADRFRFEADRIRCLTAGGLLRYLLCTEYGIDLKEISIGRDEHEKPFLIFPEKTGLEFNISHAGRWVVCALGSGRVGVDVEQIRADNTVIAAHVMTPAELENWRCTEEKKRDHAFCRLWTLKESYSKYLGLGLAMNFAGIEMRETADGHTVPRGDNHCRLRSRALGDDCYLSLCLEASESESLDSEILFPDRSAFLEFFKAPGKQCVR